MVTKKQFKNIDEYISAFPENVQVILQKVRQTIHQTVPEAEEKISYGIPTFTLNGKYMVYFAAYKNHISLYPIPSDASLQKELEPHKAGKGTLQFLLNKSIPYELIAKIAQASVVDNLERNSY